MEIRQACVITTADSPHTIARALRASLTLSDRYLTASERFEWSKLATDAWERLRGDFGVMEDEAWHPQLHSTLVMTADQLELALVAYGCALLEANPYTANEDIIAIDGLLRTMDDLRAQPPS